MRENLLQLVVEEFFYHAQTWRANTSKPGATFGVPEDASTFGALREVVVARCKDKEL